MLTDTKIRNTKATEKPLKLSDSKGLYLEIRPNGSRLWRYRYKIDGKENSFAVGQYCQVPSGETEEQALTRRNGRYFTLAEARSERERCRSLVKQSIHPSHNQRIEKIRRSAETVNTFRAIADAWVTEHKEWSESYRYQIQNRLKADAFPYIGDMPIKTVTPAHVKDVLKRVENRGAPANAKLLKTWIGGIFRYAAGELLVETDPTWPLRNSIRSPKTVHIQHLTLKEIPAFLLAIEQVQAEYATKIAMKLLWLTVVRTIELRGAEWQEFDLDAGVWTIPAKRMKMREQHIVPLSKQAIELLRSIQPMTGRGRFVFPGRKDQDQCLTHEAIRNVINRAGYAGKFTPHGVRSTFSTYFNEIGENADLIELSLGHKERNEIRAAYNHAKKLEQRRALMQEWASLTDSWLRGAEVVPIYAKAA